MSKIIGLTPQTAGKVKELLRASGDGLQTKQSFNPGVFISSQLNVVKCTSVGSQQGKVLLYNGTLWEMLPTTCTLYAINGYELEEDRFYLALRISEDKFIAVVEGPTDFTDTACHSTLYLQDAINFSPYTRHKRSGHCESLFVSDAITRPGYNDQRNTQILVGTFPIHDALYELLPERGYVIHNASQWSTGNLDYLSVGLIFDPATGTVYAKRNVDPNMTNFGSVTLFEAKLAANTFSHVFGTTFTDGITIDTGGLNFKGGILTGGSLESGNAEDAQDAVGSILTDSNTVDFTYDDSTPSITADVKTQQSITSDSSGIKLSGDSGSPGNNKLYGTDGSGVKGWYDQPTGSSYTDEEAQDAVANILLDTWSINWTYDDETPAIVGDVRYQMSVNIDTAGLKLLGDTDTPGNNAFYGTDGSGDKGWYSLGEVAQDSVGSILTDSDTVDFTYTDATPSITADVKTQMSITSDSSGVKLSGDSGSPGNLKFYGTDGSGTRGWYDQASSVYTTENAQDDIGGIFQDTDTVQLFYSDALPSITAQVRHTNSVTSDLNGVKLVGDTVSPGNNKLYGTNGSGTRGWYDQPSGSPPGVVTAFAGSSAPTGWLLCDGSAVSRSTYADLFSVISTTWGAGNGSTTFNVPDLRGRAPIGAGTGSGLTTRTLGTTGGNETHTLTVDEMPSHTHGTKIGIGAFGSSPNSIYSVNHATGQTTTATGGDDPHNNMQPWAALNFIIKT